MTPLLPVMTSLLLTAAPDRADAPAPEVTSYRSGEQQIKVERFMPKGEGKFPGLLLLHGSDGLSRRGDDYRAAARKIASRGYVVFLVHYFDKTGTRYAGKDEINKHFFMWIKAIHDGLSFAAKQPDIDPARIVLVGYSLGAYLSLSSAVLALKDEHRPAAIVEYFGGLPSLLTWGAKRIPPTLILHGEKDDKVPVREARDLEKVLREAGVPFDMKIYPKQGHGFSDKIALEAMELGFKFLEKHLKPTAPAPGKKD